MIYNTISKCCRISHGIGVSLQASSRITTTVSSRIVYTTNKKVSSLPYTTATNNSITTSCAVHLRALKRHRWNRTNWTNRSTNNYNNKIVRWSSSSSKRNVSNNASNTRWMNHSILQKLDVWLRTQRTIPIPRWITPKHYTITLSECFGHCSFILVAVSYAVDDYMQLRILAIIGSTAMLFFTYFHPYGNILWLPLKWNILFILINSYRVGKVYVIQFYSNYFLSNELLKARERCFYMMDPVDYYKLMSIATIREYKSGDIIIQQHDQNAYIRYVLQGQLKVLRNNKLVYLLNESNFLSEYGIHTGLLLPETIESCCTVIVDDAVGGRNDDNTTKNDNTTNNNNNNFDNTDSNKNNICRVIEWDRTELVQLLQRNESIRRCFKVVLTWDIVRKLKGQRKLITQGIIDDTELWTKLRQEQTQHRYDAILQSMIHVRQSQHNNNYYNQELKQYRIIHDIDQQHHIDALQKIGWTVDEFENTVGKRFKTNDNDEAILKERGEEELETR